jgi:hypothetical protein
MVTKRYFNDVKLPWLGPKPFIVSAKQIYMLSQTCWDRTTDNRLYQMNHSVPIPMIFVSAIFARLSRQMTRAGEGWVAPAALHAVYSLVRFVLCLNLKSYLLLYFCYNKWWKCESSFFADTCTRRVPIFYILNRVKSINQILHQHT